MSCDCPVESGCMDNSTPAYFFPVDKVPTPFITPMSDNPFLSFVMPIDSEVSSVAHMDQAAAQWRELFPEATVKEMFMFMAGVLAMFYWMEWRCSDDPYGIMLSTVDVLDMAEEDAMRLCSQVWEIFRRQHEDG